MIRSVVLENYRAFNQFELHDLGRVNLIVGTNNSGKTSILEAIKLIASKGDIASLWMPLQRRGEYVEERVQEGALRKLMDIKRLFHGHEIVKGSKFSLSAITEAFPLSLICEIKKPPLNPSQLVDSPELDVESDLIDSLVFSITWKGDSELIMVHEITRNGGVRYRRLASRTELALSNVQFVSTSLTTDEIAKLFDEVVLNPEEKVVINTLNIIEPSIERIASIGVAYDRLRGDSSNRSGLFLRCKSINDRIPIGTMGDGIWRLLGLALSLVQSKNGILLVDEIDTGLHYTVMEKMWKLVTETARRLNIQVFATTHSRDCFESLASVCRENVSKDSDITIQRIEREKGRSIAYTEQEIIAASQRGIEVR